MSLHDHLAFTKSERRAIIVLLAVILILSVLLAGKKKKDSIGQELVSSKTEVKHERYVTQKAPEQMTSTFDPNPSTPFAFNPNTADSATLRAVGLSPFVSSNIVKYRRAGGHFRRPSDLARIYGMDSTAFARIRPYIYIPKEERPLPARKTDHPNPTSPSGYSRMTSISSDTIDVRPPNPYKEYMENKLPSGTFLDLNKADSADLVRIPNVGPYYASQIVSLRRQLGGYVSLSQLNDIQGMPEIGDYVYVEEDAQQRINVNTASLRTLTRHPYIGYYRARAIIDLREREGRVLNLRQLSFLSEFSDEDIKRLAPYLSFE